MDLAHSPWARLFLGGWEVGKILLQWGWDLKFVLLYRLSKTSCSGISSGTRMSPNVRRLFIFLHQANKSEQAQLEVLNKHPVLHPSPLTEALLAPVSHFLHFMTGTFDFYIILILNVT